MTLRLQYSTRKQGLEDLYDLIDENGYYVGEPVPYERALELKDGAKPAPAPEPEPEPQTIAELYAWTLDIPTSP